MTETEQQAHAAISDALAAVDAAIDRAGDLGDRDRSARVARALNFAGSWLGEAVDRLAA